MDNVLARYATNPHEGMTHESYTPHDNPIGNALTQWGRGVRDRSTAEGFTNALAEQLKAPPAELAMNWTNPVSAGLVGMFAGKGAKTADVVRLAMAEKMKAAGVPDEVIHKQTGWFFGMPDGKPRFEIPDNAAKFKESPIDNISNTMPLDRALSHNDLYSAHPNLRDTKINFQEGAGGDYSGATDKINVGTSGNAYPVGTTLHELQHAIQQREGFARGGSPSVNSWASSYQRPDLLRVANQTMKEWKPASYEEFWGKEVTPDGQAAYGKYLKEFGTKEQEAQRWIAAQQGAPGKIYRNLAGEAEARLTQSRMNMTPAERAASYPVSMFDVPVDQQIVRYGDDTARSVPDAPMSYDDLLSNAKQTVADMHERVAPKKTQYELVHEVAQRNAALPVEQGGLGLPANNTSIQRLDHPDMYPMDAYHGAKPRPHIGVMETPDIKEVQISPSNYPELEAFYATQDPSLANVHGVWNATGEGAVYPLRVDPSRIVNDVRQNELRIKDKSAVRSRFAAGDPFLRNSADLLAGGAAAAVGLNALTPEYDGAYK